MLPRLYALLTDAHGADAPILVFTAKEAAQQALEAQAGEASEVVAFTCKDLMAGAVNGLLYLALTLEDTGLRIQAAFRSLLGLRAYLDEHVGETPCLTATAQVLG